MMSQLAKVIRIEKHGERGTLLIDGQEFPWHIDADDGITVHSRRGDLATITITIPADRIEMAESVNLHDAVFIGDEAHGTVTT